MMNNEIRRYSLRKKYMPEFLDHHSMPSKTSEQRNAMESQARSMMDQRNLTVLVLFFLISSWLREKPGVTGVPRMSKQ